MKPYNPVIEGIKKHGLAKNFFFELKERVNAGNGLTVREWEWYRARQKEWEPEVLEAEMAAARRRNAIADAQTLSVEDLQMIINEKIRAAALPPSQRPNADGGNPPHKS